MEKKKKKGKQDKEKYEEFLISETSLADARTIDRNKSDKKRIEAYYEVYPVAKKELKINKNFLRMLSNLKKEGELEFDQIPANLFGKMLYNLESIKNNQLKKKILDDFGLKEEEFQFLFTFKRIDLSEDQISTRDEYLSYINKEINRIEGTSNNMEQESIKKIDFDEPLQINLLNSILENLEELVIISDMNLPIHLLTFLIDLWHKSNNKDLKEITGHYYFKEFRDFFNIPYYYSKKGNLLRLFSLFGNASRRDKMNINNFFSYSLSNLANREEPKVQKNPKEIVKAYYNDYKVNTRNLAINPDFLNDIKKLKADNIWAYNKIPARIFGKFIYPLRIRSNIKKLKQKICSDFGLDEDKFNFFFDIENYSLNPEQQKRVKKYREDINNLLGFRKLVNFENAKFEVSGLFFPKKEWELLERRIVYSLKNQKHIILIGPPGSGKSKLSKLICRCYRKDRYKMSTATSDWSTFETLGGYQLQSNDKLNDKIALEFTPGIFLECFKNSKDQNVNKWLIIDEINRADIDKAFGSLFSALTGDNIELPYEKSGKIVRLLGNTDEFNKSDDKYYNYIIPKDWRIIATMNTFDKTSLYEMSYAFMRRFAFIPVPIPESINKQLIEEYFKENVWNLTSEVTKNYEDIISIIVDLWNIINEYRKVGPAIIEDLSRYIVSCIKENEMEIDLVSPLIMYVIPQFEGLSDEKIIDFSVEFEKFLEKYLVVKNKISELNHFLASYFEIDEKKFT